MATPCPGETAEVRAAVDERADDAAESTPKPLIVAKVEAIARRVVEETLDGR